MRKADDGKSSGALFSGIAGDSMQQILLCPDWCVSTGKTRIHRLKRKDPEEVTSSTGKRSAGKLACRVCAVRRFEISLSQTGGTKEEFLSYQLTRRRKPNGTRACWESGACPKAL